MKNILWCLLLSTSVLSTSTVCAETIHEPIIPAIAGIQTKALVLGFAKNQYDLGMAYYEGKLIPRNIPKAVEWLNRASAKNYAPAKVTLAKMNLTGDGVERNPQLAKQLLLQAVQKGDAEAQKMLTSLNTAPAQAPVQFQALDSALLCQNWNTRQGRISPFYDELAGHGIQGNTHKSLETALKQNYSEQNQYQYYPEYKDAYGDTPDMRIFVPRNKASALFSKIETTNNYGYGTNYEAIFRTGIDIESVKKFIEQRDSITFSSFNQSQIKQYAAEQNRLSGSNLDDEPMQEAYKKLDQKYNGLHLLTTDEQFQQVYITFKPRVVENGYVHFVDYIYLAISPNGSARLQCGNAES